MNDDAVFPAPEHDHDACIAEALANAESLCQSRGVRLTPQRRRILEIVWSSHLPIGAYDILDRMNEDGDGRAAPMTVYRALDFLIENGLVHRLASLNAYFGCDHPDTQHNTYFLICGDCGRAAEMEDREIESAIASAAQRSGFEVRHQLLEVAGLCNDCHEKA